MLPKAPKVFAHLGIRVVEAPKLLPATSIHAVAGCFALIPIEDDFVNGVPGCKTWAVEHEIPFMLTNESDKARTITSLPVSQCLQAPSPPGKCQKPGRGTHSRQAQPQVSLPTFPCKT